MNFKSLMLGAAAAASATGVQAADLPAASEPVDYVKTCNVHGARFYYIPGTDTCLRVGGRVRADYYTGPSPIVVPQIRFGEDPAPGEGYFVHKAVTAQNSNYTLEGRGSLYLDSRTPTEYGLLRTYTEINGTTYSAPILGKAYIQWGGLTFGRTNSFFDFFTGQAFIGSVDRDYSDTKTNLLAYTAAFDDGLSTTISVEKGTFHRNTGTYYGGRFPELVAALDISQDWGSAQLSGALHHVNQSAAFWTSPSGAPIVSYGDGKDNKELGWAIQGGVVLKLPMITSGSNVALQAAYADGAMSYLDAPGFDSSKGKTSSGWNFGGGVFIQATSSVGLALDGSYLDVDLPTDTNVGTAYKKYAIDGSVEWEPTDGFVMGIDMGYDHMKIDGFEGDYDMKTTLRVQRTF